MEISTIKKYIDLAKKAGAILYGLDNIKSGTQNIYLILIDNEVGSSLKRNIDFISQHKKVQCLVLNNTNLDDLLNTNNCKVIGITNINLANKIKDLIN